MKVRDPERVAGHMFRMGMMAMILEDQKSEAILGGSAIILSIVHDIAECIVGDITPHDPVTPEEKHDKEMAAMKTLVEKLPGPLAKDLYDAFSRYEFQPENDRSAIMTKDLDKFDMILQAMEYEEQAPSRGAFLEDFFNSTKGVFQTERIKTLDKELRDYRAKFHEAK
jgi:Predicted hydrolases of HD superfamily